ncbi:MAG: addiction module toxin RelE [Armatimonadetes bacterium CG2_30_59_28]|nr:type II toxin-antitoxin system RelE/ParE family toxin [Armatimonadota bacterium]OIO96799.1 MAG: addiction module toxin RelE [Armatimonadetes bacterium CG2_30_59_28]PIU62230.1 MAG: addiction module toxin RelE [Armatimonadetes bacterium CG07_land_8_20_14_0_80_59_28]PIX42349.1 MAG: addiction module toxin RelE [Armatimonadetes bacterium CG_4_8_14_3_um_filter_58_9]PIY42037.1 MAG: addiction module toxin RelE [Armatimonadetes bacterium CG_4_10_14_3_um_filter_59_10]PJB62267.1 MAG: addiction module 
MQVTQSRSFEKRVSRFSRQEKHLLDQQVRRILQDPYLGEEKKGELRGVFVHKFKIHATQYLLAYRIQDDVLELIMIGPHENYYRDLTDYLRSRP